MWEITKQFDFCYGHRVWSQKLNTEFSLDGCLACRHLHGHQGTILISLRGKELKDGMVTDFKHLGWFKKWLDDTLDHKFIMDISDPLFHTIFPLLNPDYKDYLITNDTYNVEYGYHSVKKEFLDTLAPVIKELYEGLIAVEFVPTSENLSKWIFDIVSNKMQKINVEVSKLEFFETPKSKSIYTKTEIKFNELSF